MRADVRRGQPVRRERGTREGVGRAVEGRGDVLKREPVFERNRNRDRVEFLISVKNVIGRRILLIQMLPFFLIIFVVVFLKAYVQLNPLPSSPHLNNPSTKLSILSVNLTSVSSSSSSPLEFSMLIISPSSLVTLFKFLQSFPILLTLDALDSTSDVVNPPFLNKSDQT